MSKPIDLGRTLDDMISVKEVKRDKPHYPELFISDTNDKRIANMPDTGTATIKYRVASRTHRQEKGEKDSCSLRLEIISIDPPAGAKRKGGYGDDARKALSEYFK